MSWLAAGGFIVDGQLAVNPYEKHFDLLFKYRSMRSILRALWEYGPLHIRYLSRILRINFGLVSRGAKALQAANLVVVKLARRGERALVAFSDGIQISRVSGVDLLPKNFRDAGNAFTKSLQLNLPPQYIRSLVFAYDGNHGRMYVIPMNSNEDVLTAITKALSLSATRSDQALHIVNLSIVNRAAWLRQLLGMTNFAPELMEAFDAPPIAGEKPHPNELFESVFEQAPPTSEDIERWLRKRIIEPKGRSYAFTARGLHAIQVRGRLHLKPQKERVQAGTKTVHLILS
jgi:hypothetical protein